MQKNSFLLLVLVFVFGNEIKAQEKLSLSDAVKIALQNSYDIKLVENSVTIAKNNNSYGVAGALPNVTIKHFLIHQETRQEVVLKVAQWVGI
jgi:hypothetical protein